MRRIRIAAAVAVLVALAGATAVPTLSRYRLHDKLRAAIDRNAPDSPAVIADLERRGADLRTRGEGGDTVAMVAAFWNDPQLLQAALASGVDPNAVDFNYGNTALTRAMYAAGAEPTRILLRAGARVNHQDKSGDTALMYAVRNAQYDIISLLLDAGAGVDLRNAKGETALALAGSLQPGGSRPMRPDLTAQDFVRLLDGAKRE